MITPPGPTRGHSPGRPTCDVRVLTAFPSPPPSGVEVALTLRGCKSFLPVRTRPPAFVPFVRFGPGAPSDQRKRPSRRSERAVLVARLWPAQSFPADPLSQQHVFRVGGHLRA